MTIDRPAGGRGLHRPERVLGLHCSGFIVNMLPVPYLMREKAAA